MITRICVLAAAALLIAAAQAVPGAPGVAAPSSTATATSTLAGAKPEVIAQRLEVTSRAYRQLAARFSVESYRLGHEDDPMMTVSLHVRAMAEYLTAADIVLEAANDDAGGSLLAGAKVQGSRVTTREPSSISRDHHDAFLDVSFTQAPAAGAKELTLRGFARLQVGRQKKSMHAVVPLVPATKFGPPNLPFRITHVSGNGSGLNFELEGPAQLDRITGISFSDDQGHLLATKPGSIEGPSVFNPQTSKIRYDLPTAPDNMQVDLSWYDGVEDIQVPFELKLGAGFEGK